ncbi:elongation factor P hydroxylase [Catenovulum maritimum]|uniref:Elongation factor P hydroxylase n=1 Tax=Catenovulum maritimum TaxID=1513271 RepID=A0A0J8GQP5_9ALTE|nr:elongation factor P hydroxylase [Catenovulum maritimum]KMT65115.1 elongation factor P hydroxylase [Catenovulum maritimum]
MPHRIKDLIEIFDNLFFPQLKTRLISGVDEPIYLPADDKTPYHQVVFANGFYASALHEIAHWCIAGEARRKQIDYGYWYNPDGRDESQQIQFEQVEIKPQAIEWILSTAANFNFKVSCDNLNGEFEPDRHQFRAKIHQQVQIYLSQGLPKRVEQLVEALSQFYQTPNKLCLEQFNLDES